MDPYSNNTTVPSADIEELIKKINSVVMATEIYYRPFETNDAHSREIVILISNKSTRSLQEISPLLDVIAEKYPGTSYRLYYVHQVKEAIKRGNLIFYLLCDERNLFYQAPESDKAVFPEIISAADTVVAASEVYINETTKIAAFTEGVQFYWEKGNFPQTAFMIQQQIELSFRAIEVFAMGKEKITHSIQAHQKYVSAYLPGLGKFFDPENEYELELLKLTDKAYTAVRYEQNFRLTREQCTAMMAKGEEIVATINSTYQRLAKELEEVVTSSKNNMEKIALPSAALTKNCETEDSSPEGKVVSFLRNKLQIEAIYCLAVSHQTSSRTGYLSGDEMYQESLHQYLLVITGTEPPPAAYTITGEFNQSQALSGTVTLFIHSLKDVREGLRNNVRFFHHALHSAKPLFINDHFPADLSEIEYNDNQKSSQCINYKYQRFRRADTLLDSSDNISEWDDGDIQLALLHLAMEQLCLGLIYAKFDYVPNLQTLSHLLDICRLIVPETDQLFPRTQLYEKESFGLLADGLKKLRFSVSTHNDPADIFFLHTRCRTWCKRAKEITAESVKKEEHDNTQAIAN